MTFDPSFYFLLYRTMIDGSNEAVNDNENGGQLTALHDLIAGGVAGSLSVVVGHPFDTIKVRLQTSNSSNNGGTFGTFRSLFKGMGAPLSTASMVNAIIFATYGSSSRLWENVFEGGKHVDVHGVATREGGGMLEHGDDGTHEQVKIWAENRKQNLNAACNAEFGSSNSYSNTCLEWPSFNQEATPELVQDRHDVSTINPAQKEVYQQNMLKVFICGALAGTVQAFVICPMEHIKCRLQVQSEAMASSASHTASTSTIITRNKLSPQTRSFSTIVSSSKNYVYTGPIDCGLSIIKNYGIFHGLFRGMGVTLWRETPAFGMYFATYDSIKARVETFLEDKGEHHPIPSHSHAWAASALAGGISGASTWAIIYPFDVIKSRMQTGPLERHLQKGMWTVARDIVNEHGFQYMFRGLGITLIRAFPVNAIIFPVYEFVLLQLSR